MSDVDNVAQDSSTTSQNDGGGELTYLWLSKDDKVVGLTLEDFGTLGSLIADFKNSVWQEKYITYKVAIEQAETLESLADIELEY